MGMTSKERAALRKQANTITAIFQIGKEDVTEPLVEAVDAALQKRELIKLSVLETCPSSVRDAANRLAAKTEAEVVQTIGRKMVLYRERREEEPLC